MTDQDVQHLRELAEAAAQGDRAAADRLLERFLPDLRAFVRLRAGPLIRARESASDLVQSVCREVLENAERFRFPHEAAYKQWLFATALRKISKRRDYYRAQKRDVLREVAPAASSRTGAGDRQIIERYRTISTPSGRAMVQEEMARVEAAFDHLTSEQREVITLAHVVGLSRAEIAEQMNKNEGAVRVILHRGLARLSSLLATES